MPEPRRRWLPWLVLVMSLLVAAYCFSGYAMAASFSVANPERLEHWRSMAMLYIGGTIGGLLITLGTVISLVRQRGLQ